MLRRAQDLRDKQRRTLPCGPTAHSRAPIVCFFIELGDDRAGGLFKQAGDNGMDKCSTRRQKQLSRKFASKQKMLKKRLVNFCRVVEKDAVDHSGSFELLFHQP